MDENDMLRLSIIVNMFNTAKYMQKCVDSLLCQDIPAEEYEIIFVDDCSPDNSLEMANHYKEEGLRIKEQGGSYPQIKVCHHDVNKGLAAARNTGVAAAEGKYLRFVDPDDYVEKNSFAALLTQMDNENLDVLRFDYQKVDEDYHPIPHNHAEQQFDLTPGIMTGAEFLGGRLGVACYVWSYIFRTSLINGKTPITFIEDCYFDDTPWLPRVLLAAQRVNSIPIKMHYYLQRQTSMVRAQNTDAFQRQKKGLLGILYHLQMQYRSLHGEIDSPVDVWYRRQVSFIALSLMGLTLNFSKKEANETYRAMQKLCVFPIRYEAYNKKTVLIKELLINISPRLYWRLLHKKMDR